MLPLQHTYSYKNSSVAWGCLGDGPPLVLLHGTPFSSQVWRRIAPLLASRWRVYYFDLLGYGESDKGIGIDVSLEVQNRLFTALVGEWQLKRPHVLCHDFGAATALRGYFLNGLRYASLTTFDAVALSPWGSPLVQHVREHERAFSNLPAYAHEALLEAYLRGAAFRPLTSEAMEVYKKPWLGDQGQRALYQQIAQMDQRYTEEVQSFYERLDCPVTVLWGEQDQWLPISQGSELAARISDQPLVAIPDAGHLVQEDAPEAIVAAMLTRVAI
jgi:pimeloyl-ACP methyl ester carboxylesterase